MKYKCNFCQPAYTADLITEAIRHSLAYHYTKNVEFQDYECPCGRNFSKRHSLLIHIGKIHGFVF